MKSPWKYPNRIMHPGDNHAHDINRKVVDDPHWNIQHCEANIEMLEKEVRKSMDLVDYWKTELNNWKQRTKIGDLYE